MSRKQPAAETTGRRALSWSAAPGSATHRWLLACGAAGAVLFNLTYLLEGVTRPGYNAWRQPVSALSLGPGGWVQQINFIVFGLLVACFAVGLRATLAPGVGATWAPLLEIFEAVGLVLAGIFVQDPTGYPPGVPAVAAPTTHGFIHLVASVLALVFRVAWCFVMARRFAREPGWRGWALYAVVTGLLMMAFLAAFGALNNHTGPAGLFERLATGVASILTIALVARLLLRGGWLNPPAPVATGKGDGG